MTVKPAFIAFTGVDSADLASGLCTLSARYPIEWGMLIDDARSDEVLFAGSELRLQLLRLPGLRWAAHVCGDKAREIANAPDEAHIDLTGFQRLQVNHGFEGSTLQQADNVVRFARSRAVRGLLQVLGDFPDDARLDWLFDVSFGRGVKPAGFPALPSGGPFCGFSGGIHPGNAAAVVAAIGAGPDVPYWIDMESGVRSNGRLDLGKCEAVCRAVYG